MSDLFPIKENLQDHRSLFEGVPVILVRIELKMVYSHSDPYLN